MPGFIFLGLISENMAAVPQSSFDAISHDRIRPLGGHLSFKLGEDHNELHHGLTGWHRRIKFFAKRNDVHIVLIEERPQIDEIFEASRDAIELEADYDVNLAGGDVAFQSFKLRAVLIFRGLAGVDVELQRVNLPTFTAFAKFDFLFDLVLLRDKAVTFGCLPL